MTARTANGRPLRFLGTVMAAWIGLRVFLLWPHLESPRDLLRAMAPVAVAVAEPPPAAPQTAGLPAPQHRVAVAFMTPPVRIAATDRPPHLVGIAQAPRAPVRDADAKPVEATPILPGLPPSPPVAAAQPRASRWSGSFWLVARGGSGIAPGALGGQLGGSQAGARLAYRVDRKHRIAIVARVATPLGTGLREAALGLEWQPTRLPIRVIAEERFALNGGRGGPAIGVVGGFGPLDVPMDFALEGYGQAGAIRRRETEAFADGAVRLHRAVKQIGAARIDLGAGAWGGAQRGAARLDLGPSLGVTAPLGRQPVRLTLDWRQRVAGDARPGSGPAVTLGTDF